MTRFNNELEKYDFMEKSLYAAAISDALGELGITDRIMRENIRPIHPDNIIVGKARTMLWMDVYEVYEHPYKIEIEAMDSL